MKIESLHELKNFVENNSKIANIKSEIDKVQSQRKNKEYATSEEIRFFDEKLLLFIEEVLKSVNEEEYMHLGVLYEEIYLLQYSFCLNELNDEWQISEEVKELFFEFQKNRELAEMIKKIEELRVSLINQYVSN